MSEGIKKIFKYIGIPFFVIGVLLTATLYHYYPTSKAYVVQEYCIGEGCEDLSNTITLLNGDIQKLNGVISEKNSILEGKEQALYDYNRYLVDKDKEIVGYKNTIDFLKETIKSLEDNNTNETNILTIDEQKILTITRGCINSSDNAMIYVEIDNGVIEFVRCSPNTIFEYDEYGKRWVITNE